MTMYALHSNDVHVVRHSVSLMWKHLWALLSSNETQRSEYDHLLENEKLWRQLSALILCDYLDIEFATIHCIHGLFQIDKYPQKTLQHDIQERLIAFNCIENLCVKLITPFDLTQERSRCINELTARTFANICTLVHQVERVCGAGGMDAFTFLAMKEIPSDIEMQHHTMIQVLAFECMTSCIKLSPACVEDIEQSDVFVYALNKISSSNSCERKIYLEFLATSMQNQPLICKVLLGHGLLQILLSMLVAELELLYPALSALKCIFSCPTNSGIAQDTYQRLRISNGLMNLCWIATRHKNKRIKSAAMEVLALLFKWTSSCSVAQDLIEHGCVLLLCQKNNPMFSNLIKSADEEVLSSLLGTLVRTSNTLLKENIILGILLVGGHKLVRKDNDWSCEEWLPVVQLSVVECSDFEIQRHVILALITLCSPHAILHEEPDRVQKQILQGTIQVTSKNHQEIYTVSKSSISHWSHLVARLLYRNPTIQQFQLPSMTDECLQHLMALFQCRQPSIPTLNLDLILEIASIAQKLEMDEILFQVKECIKQRYVHENCSYILQKAVSMKIPSLVLLSLEQMLHSQVPNVSLRIDQILEMIFQPAEEFMRISSG